MLPSKRRQRRYCGKWAADMVEIKDQKFGYVSIIGAPNAGKSTLLNALLGSKLSIVSPRVQTTRFRLQGIAMLGNAQMVLVDTPGLFSGKSRLDRAMLDAANRAYQDADILVLLFDLRQGVNLDLLRLLPAHGTTKQQRFYVLNKMDLADPARINAAEKAIRQADESARIFVISALHGHALEPLKQALIQAIPTAPWLYPAEQLSDISERLWAAEITREQIFLQLAEEVPYGIYVETEKWEDFKNGAVKISQIIVVSREAYKPIILGKGGAQIKRLREAAQAQMAEVFGREAHLFLFVKVRPDWQENRQVYGEMGLEYNS